MIYYTIDAALGAMAEGDELCVSTDDFEIREKVQDYGLSIPFVRPESLATDTTTTNEVIQHALEWYKSNGLVFDIVVLLQPTSPLRNAENIRKALSLWDENSMDLLLSVKETDANPYYVLFEENEKGYLIKAKSGNFSRRQDCPSVYELNGAIYIFPASYDHEPTLKISAKTKKIVMDKVSSIDVDDRYDFLIAEMFLQERNL